MPVIAAAAPRDPDDPIDPEISRSGASSRPPRGGAFIGRTADLERLHRLLDEHTDLITLTGPGGVGKTQLAARLFEAVADGRHPRFTHGAAFIRLDPVTDPAMVPTAIAEEFRLKEVGDRAPLERVVAHLRGLALLVILDNFEHVLDAAPVVTALLQECPEVAVVATSRRHLHLTGETVYHVEPLPVPPASTWRSLNAASALQQIVQVDAVQLLSQRAQARDRRFALTDVNAPDLAEICRRVDGLPLAIEVVAPRLAVLGPGALLAELRAGHASTSTGPVDAQPRHQSVANAVAWSYAMLDPATQGLFRRLSVFVDGGTLPAIGAVASPDVADPAWVADAVYRLCDESLIRGEPGPDGHDRFSMLVTTREFAAAQLDAAGDQAASLAAHARYFTKLATTAESGLGGADHARWGAVLDAEIGNLRLALATAIESPAPDLHRGLQLASALWPYWDRRGYRQEAITWLKRATEASLGESTAHRSAALRRLGNALGDTDTRAALAAYEEALGLARSTDEPKQVAALLRNVSVALIDQGHYEKATALLAEAEATCVRANDVPGRASVIALMSRVFRESKNQADADAVASRLLALISAVDDFELRIWTYLELGRNALASGDLPKADVWLGRGLELADDLAEREWVAYATLERGAVRFGQRDVLSALTDFHFALRTLRETNTDFGVVLCLERIASIAAASDQPDRALLLWASIDAWRGLTGYAIPASERDRRTAEHAATLAVLRRSPAPVPSGDLALTLEQATQVALAVSARAVAKPGQQPIEAPASAMQPTPLSRRETQVLALIAQSHSNQEIADQMYISTSTAMKHVEHIFEKLGVNRRMEAVRVARQSGWLPTDA